MNGKTAAAAIAALLISPVTFAADHEQTGFDMSALEWATKVKLTGDVRMRYQNDDDASRDGDRTRVRLRARILAAAQATETLDIGIGLAAGSQDPVSANQTIGELNASKDINLDLAYFRWKSTENTTISGGKFKNNVHRPGGSELQWDNDWRPEGANGTYDGELFFGNAILSWLDGEEDDRDGNEDDIKLGIVQLGVKTELAGAKVKAGVGYTTADTEGQVCLFKSNEADCGQNTDGGAGTYAADFSIVDVFAEAAFEVAGMPLLVWGQYANNSDAPVAPSGKKLDSGYNVGAKLGKAKKKGTWQLEAFYQDVDADASIAGLSNSNFAGGGTDAKGYVFVAKYALSDKSTFRFRYFATEDKNERFLNGVSEDFDVLQLDIEAKF